MKSEKNVRGDFAADRRLLLLTAIAIPVGVVCAFVALALVSLITAFTNLFFYGTWSFTESSPSFQHWGWFTIFVPAIGGLIIGLMARYGSERIRGHGIPEALEAILFGKSIMSPKVALLKPLSSAISIGSGGPFGAEGPIIMTGGAFGSILAQTFKLSAAERKTILVAGAAAGMSAIFASPVAAVLLAIELLLFEWRPRSLIPVAVASIIASALRPMLLGAGPIFPIAEIAPPTLSMIAIAAGLGTVAGAFAIVVSATLYKLEDQFPKMKIHWMWWPALGGLAVGIGAWFEPRVLGVGYDIIGEFLKGNVPPEHAVGLVAIKSLVWVIALASGTSGGVLAPLLIMGSGLGALFAHYLPGQSSVWALVGMAGVMGGMMRSPFTAIVFALELTHQINALPTLLSGTIMAYGFTVLCMRRSILTEKVARRGYDIFREYSVDPLERMRIKEVMSTKVVSVPQNLGREEILKEFFGATRKHRGYPVVNDLGELCSIITESDLLSETPAKAKTPIVAYADESCCVAAERMASQYIGRLLVVDRDDHKKLVGIITRSDLLKARIRSQEEEKRRERFLSVRQVSKARV